MSEKPTLSILIPTLPSRRKLLESLFDKLQQQAFGRPVEILALCDNRRMSIGEKCNALLDIARGEFIAFVDDDDWVSESYVEEILKAIEEHPSDVVTFRIFCKLKWANGMTQEGWIWPDVNDENEEFHNGTVKRKPLQIAVWRSTLAKSSRWADAQMQADTAWASKLWPQIKTQYKIDRILYHYLWSETGTEAK